MRERQWAARDLVPACILAVTLPLLALSAWTNTVRWGRHAISTTALWKAWFMAMIGLVGVFAVLEAGRDLRGSIRSRKRWRIVLSLCINGAALAFWVLLAYFVVRMARESMG